MSPEITPEALPQYPSADVQAQLAYEKQEAAACARTVGEYTQELHARAEALLAPQDDVVSTADVQEGDEPANSHPPREAPAGDELAVLESSMHQEKDLAEQLKNEAIAAQGATAGAENLAIDQGLDPGTLGMAQLNGGDGTIVLNQHLLTQVTTEDGREQFTDTVAHERAHANDQKAMESIIIDTTGAKDGWYLNEAHSEFSGRKAVRQDKSARREGQPHDYAEAQDTGLKVLNYVTEAEFNTAMAEGDTEGLQTAVWEARLVRGEIDVDELMRQGAELGEQQEQIAGQIAVRHMQEQLRMAA